MRSDRYAVVDVETTGFSPRDDRIVELACVCVDADRVVERWSTLIDPEMPIPARATDVHGITNAMVHGAPTFARALPRLAELCGSRRFVAHSARFDLSFLQQLGVRDAICTLRLSRTLFPHAPNHRNQTLRAFLDLDRAIGEDLSPHRALDDALVTAHLLIACRATFSPRYWGVSWRRFIAEEAAA